MTKEVITLSGIMEFFKGDLNSVMKGESKYKAGFVLELKVTEFMIKAQVRASMKGKSYIVSLTVDGDGGISKGKCDCPRGKWICGHMAATSIYANKKGLSKTDLPNFWIARPKKAAKLDTKPFVEYFPSPRTTYKATSRPVSHVTKNSYTANCRALEFNDALNGFVAQSHSCLRMIFFLQVSLRIYFQSYQ